MDDEKWLKARLIPVSGLGGQEEKERRATSALLAVITAVKEFGRALLRPLGAPAGAIDAFCEVPFELSDGRKLRVDGAIVVRRGKKTWTLLVEVKTGTNELSQHQVEDYLQIVREQNFDGLLTISNQIVHAVDQHPVKVTTKRLGRIPLYHVSWVRILTIAHLVKEHEGVSDPDQAWILGELIRYLEYDGSGALTFEDMGLHWPAVRNAARYQTLRAADEGVRETALRWDQLIEYLCLGLAARLGTQVRPVITRREAENPDLRTSALVQEVADRGTLSASIRIPDAVGPLYIRANLRAMTAEASIEVEAPDTKRPAARVNWLLRQLKGAPADTRIDAAFLWARDTSSDLLERVAQDPKRILLDGSKPPKSFRLALARSVGSKRKAGKGGFVTDLSALVDHFYREVVQSLKPWTQPAPKLPVDGAQDSVVQEQKSPSASEPTEPSPAP